MLPLAARAALVVPEQGRQDPALPFLGLGRPTGVRMPSPSGNPCLLQAATLTPVLPSGKILRRQRRRVLPARLLAHGALAWRTRLSSLKLKDYESVGSSGW